MRALLKQNSVFLVLCLLLWAGLSIALLSVDKLALHLWFNSCHTPWQDAFFPIATKLGEWVPYVVAGLLLFYKFGWSAFLLVNIWISGLVGQLFKHLINAPRPYVWLMANYPDIHFPLVEGIAMKQALSFPSGHTISCFALCTTLSIILTEKHHTCLSILCFLLAITGAYSRIYLSQHFAMDIWGGMIIGVVTTLLLYYLFARLSRQKWYNMHFFAKKVH